MQPRAIDIQPVLPWPCFGVEIDRFRLERVAQGWRLRIEARRDPRATPITHERYREEIGREAAAYLARAGLPVEAGRSVLAPSSLVDPQPITRASASYPLSREVCDRLDALSAHQIVALQTPNPGYTLQLEA